MSEHDSHYDRFGYLAEEVSILQRDMAKVGTLVDRLDTAITKLTDISNSVSSLLAVHESKIIQHDNLIKTQADTIEKRRVEVEDKISDLYDHLASIEKETQEKLDKQYDEILVEIKELRIESANQHAEMRKRISVMEKWMWTVIGTAVALSQILDKINIGALFG